MELPVHITNGRNYQYITESYITTVCFSGWSENQGGRHGLWVAETFSTSLKPLNGILQNLTGSKNSTSSTKCVFFRADRKTHMAVLTYDWLRHCRQFLWNCWTEFDETWQDASTTKSYPHQFCDFRADRKTKIILSWLICQERWNIVSRCTILVIVGVWAPCFSFLAEKKSFYLCQIDIRTPSSFGQNLYQSLRLG